VGGVPVLNRNVRRVSVNQFVSASEARLLVVVPLLILVVMIASTQIHAPPWLHSLALFGHLAALVAGLGAVLGVDYFGMLWLLRRIRLQAMLLQVHRMGPMIWSGLVGLVLTGALLHPQLTTPLIMIKMASVIGVSVVGILALATKRAMMRSAPRVPPELMLRGLVLTAASQAFWWTAVLVGFLTANPDV
jgi:hypothetical protein